MSDKQIKFSFVLDQESLKKVDDALKSLTDKAALFAQELNKAGGGMTSGSATAGGGASTTSQPVPGMGPNTSSTGPKNFTMSLVQTAQALKNLGTEADASFKKVAQAINTGVGVSQQKLTGLMNQINAMKGSFGGLLNMPSGGAASGYNLGGGGGMPPIPPGGAPPGTPPGGGGWNPFGGVGGTPLSPGAQFALQQFGMGGLSGLARFGTAGAVAGLAKIPWNFANEQWSAMMRSSTIAPALTAERVTGRDEYISKLRSGDLSDITSMREINEDPERRREFMQSQGLDEGSAPGEGWYKKGWRWIGRQARYVRDRNESLLKAREAGQYWSDIGQGEDSPFLKQVREQSLREQLDLQTQGRGQYYNAVFKEAISDPYSKMSQMRALGIGGTTQKYGAERFLNAFNQFSPGEVTGAVQGIAGSGTRGAAYANNSALLSAVLQAQAGGINGAANVAGVMSRGGAGQGVEFINLLRSLQATTGTDVSTSGLLGNYASQRAESVGVSSVDYAGMLGVLSAGTGGKDGAMVARQNIAGMESLQGLFSGGKDNAQKAMNLLKAMKVAPDIGYYGQRYLSQNLDIGQLQDIMSGRSKITDAQEKILGPNASKILKGYYDEVIKTQNVRVSANGFRPGSDARALVEEAQANNLSLPQAAKKLFGKDTRRANAVLSAVLMPTSKNEMEATGLARDQLNVGRLATDAPGKRTSDVAGGSTASLAAGANAQKDMTDIQVREAKFKEIEGDLAASPDSYKRMVANQTNLNLTAEQIATILGTAATQLHQVISKSKASAPGASSQQVKPK